MFHKTLNTSRITAVCLFAGLAVSGISAQSSRRDEALDSLISRHQIIYADGSKGSVYDPEVRSIIEEFYVDQFENTRQPQAPYFLFMSRDNNFAMGVGGDVRLRAYFDPGNSLPSSSFAPVDIPVTRDDLNRNHFATSPAGTALYFRIFGRNQKLGRYSLYIKAKFNGGAGKDFKLNKAYATINDWTLGYATSTFSDGDAEPPTVDDNGTTLSMDYTTLLVRYCHNFGKSGVSIAGSVESPTLTLNEDPTPDGDYLAKARSQSVPDLSAMVQYSWAKNQHVRLSGIVRWLPYRDLVANKNHTPVGYGLQLSTVFSPVRPVVIYGTLNAGRSYTNNDGDFLLGEYDLVGGLTPGTMKTVPSWSYLVGASYYFSHKLFSNVSFGQARVTSHKLADQYRYGIYGGVSLFYNITPRIQTGAEFDFGKRQNFDGAHGWARRLNAMIQFNF